MAGYQGYSMSNNAVAAYNHGEKPLSRWTKSDIIGCIAEVDESKIVLAKKLLVTELRDFFLDYSSWHHTSCHYNQTDFYSFLPEKVEKLDQEMVDIFVRGRKPVPKKDPEEVERKKAIREFERICKVTNQNTWFIDKKMITECSTEEIKTRTALLNRLASEFRPGKYKTVRGYVADALRHM